MTVYICVPLLENFICEKIKERSVKDYSKLNIALVIKRVV